MRCSPRDLCPEKCFYLVYNKEYFCTHSSNCVASRFEHDNVEKFIDCHKSEIVLLKLEYLRFAKYSFVLIYIIVLFAYQVRQLLGDTVLRGEELKKYVNSLRTKSTVYKRHRANLSTFKVSFHLQSD